MLHIHNGDSTANILKEFGFPGEHSAFRAVLMAGPGWEASTLLTVRMRGDGMSKTGS